MLVYLVAFLVTLIPVIRFDLMRIDGDRKVWAYCELAMLILIAGLRYRVGGDTLIYISSFEEYPTIDELAYFDFAEAKYNPLWYIYNSVFKTFGDSFTFFQIVQAIIVNVCFFRFFRRYSPMGFFTCVFVYYVGYYCYFNMEVLRETLCICIFLEALPFMEKKKFLPYFLLCFVAILIHTGSAIMLLFPLALLWKRDRFWMSLICIAGAFVLLQVVNIIDILLGIAFEGATAKSVAIYLDAEARNINGVIIAMLKTVPFLIVFWLRRHLQIENDRLLGALLIFMFLFQVASSLIFVLARLSNYIFPLGIVFLVNTFYLNFDKLTKQTYSKIFLSAALFIYFFNLTYYYYTKQDAWKDSRLYYVFVPYHSIFDPQEDHRREKFIFNLRNDE